MQGRLTPNRQIVRRAVARQIEIIQEAERRGENVDQLILDLDDEFQNEIAEYSDSEREWLNAVYLQEIDAAYAHIKRNLQRKIDDTQRKLSELREENERQINQGEAAGAFIAFVVVVLVGALFIGFLYR